MTMDAIEICGISKNYRKVSAVRNISLSVGQGEIFGLIGPDGAGKTTLFRIMTTLMLADSGRGRICGMDIVKDYFKIRRIIGYMPGRFSLYQDLSLYENLDFFATLFGTTVRDSYGGMKQKLALCCALVHKPSVLFLDEPTTGVDAVSRKDFWTMLDRIRLSGVTIFVSTPYMDEASLCDRLALIKEGEIIGTGTPSEIISRYPYRILSIKAGRMYPLLKALRQIDGVLSCFSFGDSHHLAYSPERTSMQKILAEAAERGFTDCTATEITPGIEDCFMQLSKKWTQN